MYIIYIFLSGQIRGKIRFNILSQIFMSVEDTSGLHRKCCCNLINKCPCQIWVGCGCWYFAEVLVWYLTTHRDLSKIVLLVETCQISRDQTNISQKHQEFQNENFPLNIPCYMRRRRWRGCWDWQIWVLWWVILWKEENFPAWPPVDQQSNNLTIEDNLSRGGQLTRREGQSHVDLLCHNILSVLRALQPLQPAVLDFPIKVTALSDGWQSHSQSVAAREGWRAEILHWAGPALWARGN